MHDERRPESPNSAAAATSSRRRLTTRRKLTFAAVALLAGLLSLEGAARVLIPDNSASRFKQMNHMVVFLGTQESDLMLEFDDERFWKLQPSITIDDPNNTFWQGTVSNSLGYRSPEFQLAKTEGTLRIVCFGDSSTFGIGATMEDTWPYQLENLLNESGMLGKTVQVINAGVPGYSSHQGLQHMKQELNRLQPDLVMASYANNDFWHWDQTTDRQHAEQIARTTSINSLLSHSRFAQWVGSLIPEPTPANAGGQLPSSPNQHWARAATANYFRPLDGWVKRVPIDAFRDNLNQMADLCSERNLPLVFVKWPDQPQAAGNWSPRIEYQDVIDEIADERELAVANVVSEFQQNKHWSVKTYIPNDIVHVNKHGNRLAAGAAMSAIRKTLCTDELLTN